MVKSKMIVIGDAALVQGFRLAGLEYTVQTDKDNFERILGEYLNKNEFGIIIVNEGMLLDIDWKLKKRIDSIAYPVVVPIPDVGSPAGNNDEIRRIIKRALGFDLGARK